MGVEALWPDVLSEAEMSRGSHTEVREVLLGRGRKESAEMGIEILLLVLSFKKMYILNSVCNYSLLYCTSMAVFWHTQSSPYG